MSLVTWVSTESWVMGDLTRVTRVSMVSWVTRVTTWVRENHIFLSRIRFS